MSDEISLLPPNATPLMRAISLLEAERQVPTAALLQTLWDPKAAPAQTLPFLAAGLGVSLWNPAWSEERKRRVIARSIVLKRRRGTISSFEEHLGFVDAELLQVIAAPQRAVLMEPMTPAERRIWTAQFPELRIYRRRSRARLPGVFAPGRWRAPHLTPMDSVAADHFGLRAVVIDGASQRAGAVKELGEALVVSLPTAGPCFTLGRESAAFMTPMNSAAEASIFTLRKSDRGPDTLRPGVRAIDIPPLPVAEPLSGVAAFVAGSPLAGPFRFTMDSRAGEAGHDSFRLFEPSRVKAGRVKRRPGLFPGISRFGQPAFHLELAVDLPHRRRKVRRFPNVPGFLEDFDPSRMNEMLAAVRAAKLGRDKVEVRTSLHRPITFGDRIPLDGSRRLGQVIRSL